MSEDEEEKVDGIDGMSSILSRIIHDTEFSELLHSATIKVLGREQFKVSDDQLYWSTRATITMQVLCHLANNQVYYKELDQ